jgi:hypothetical protein
MALLCAACASAAALALATDPIDSVPDGCCVDGLIDWLIDWRMRGQQPPACAIDHYLFVERGGWRAGPDLPFV